MSQPERIRIAIIGAGIAGLTLAVALNAFDKDRRIAIDLYEATPELSEIGAGINVWPKTWKILKQIGLEESLIPLLDHIPDLERRRIVFEMRKADQKDGFKVTDILNDGGVFRIHRAHFQRSLIQHLPLPGSSVKHNSLCQLHLSHRLVDYAYTSTPPSSSTSPSGPVTLFFSDKPPASCDILVGADGIKSTLRRLFLSRLPSPERYERFMEPIFSGTAVYRGLVSKEELGKVFPGHRTLDSPGVMYFGKNKHVVVYPISGGKLINVVAGIHDKSKEGTIREGPWNTEVSQRELFDRFDGWEDEFQALIHCIKRPTKWLVHKMDHLNIFAKERVFLMGDSAHAMVPHQGAGAGIGIEDAYIFASLLTDASTSGIPSAQYIKRLADTYNTVRVPRAITMAKASVTQGDIFVLEVPGCEQYKEGDDVPKELMIDLCRRAERNWSWTTSDPEEDRRSALSLGGRCRAKL